ncbi:MAG: AI-2E family transporter [Armatimonadota bacterium]|nr:MAG: AI-2E family transporter [Armatimonadota bacterium]
MDLPTALVAVIAVAVIAYIVTVVHTATMRTLGRKAESYRPEERLLAWPKWLSALVGILLVAWLLYRVRAILLPFALGAVIAYLLNPMIDRLERKGWTRSRAIWVVFGVFLLFFAVGVLLLVPALIAQARDVIAEYDDLVADARQLAGQAQDTVEGWRTFVGILPADVRTAFGKFGEKAEAYALSLLSGSMGWLNRSLIVVSLLIITPVVTFWVLRDYYRLGRQMLRALPERQRDATVMVLRDINRVAGGYLLGMATMVIIVGIFATIVLTVAGVRFSVLLGIMTGVLYVIPYLGFPTAMAAVALTMAVTNGGLGGILIVLGVLLAGNICFDYGVTPRIIGRRVGLHPLVVIFAVLAGATLFKFVGIVLAVPLAGAIKVVLLHFWPEVFGQEPADAAGA